VKRLTSALLAIVLCLGLTACSGGSESSSNDVVVPNLNNAISSPNSTETANSIDQTDTAKTTQDINNTLNEVSQSSTENVFYGNWVVKQQFVINPANFDRKTAKNLLRGKKLVLSDKLAKFDNDVCQNPSYGEKQFADYDFALKTAVEPKILGIFDPTITTVTVYSEKDQKKVWNSPGSHFIVKDKDTLILAAGGTQYYTLSRIK
jgi:hypothetical protein